MAIKVLRHCKRCDRDLPLTSFYARQGWCKECYAEWDSKHKARRRAEYDPAHTPPEKACGRCKEVKPASEFPVDRARKGGLFSYCRTCVAEGNAKRYARRGKAASRRRAELKRYLIGQMGGKCTRCGYKEFFSGIDFHHSAGKKESHMAALLTNAAASAKGKNSKAFAELEAEVAKTILLCRNCHGALHAGEWSMQT